MVTHASQSVEGTTAKQAYRPIIVKVARVMTDMTLHTVVRTAYRVDVLSVVML